MGGGTTSGRRLTGKLEKKVRNQLVFPGLGKNGGGGTAMAGPSGGKVYQRRRGGSYAVTSRSPGESTEFERGGGNKKGKARETGL